MKKFAVELFIVLALSVFGGCIAMPQAEVETKEEKTTETTKPAEETITTPETSQMTEVSLFYYNEMQDKDTTGNAMCSENAVLPVKRQIAKSDKLIEDTLNLLLKGEITSVEKDQGFKTEYPLAGFSIKKSTLDENGKLTLEFEDLQNKSSGGSCRIGILWFQIKKTAMQFPEVKEVSFLPETLFQP